MSRSPEGQAGPADPGHLSRELLDGMYAGERSAFDVLRRAVGHLEAECPGCRGALAAAPVDPWGAIAVAEERARADEAALDGERRALPEVLRELDAVGSAGAFLRVSTDPRFHTAAFVAERLRQAREQLAERAFGPARKLVDQAHLAAVQLDVARYGAPVVRRLEAQVWLLWALASAGEGAADEAADLLVSAVRLARGGVAGPELRAGILYTLARVRLLEGRPERARLLLERAAEPGEHPGRGEPTAARLLAGGTDRWWWPVCTALAALDRAEGRPEDAVERLEACPRRPERPDEWNALRELLRALLDAGRPERVEALLDSAVAPPAGAGAPDPLRGAQAALVRGQTLHRLGFTDEAAERLHRARRELLFLGRGVAAAEALVELARLLRAAGRRRQVRAMLADLEPFAHCPDLGGEQLAALARCAGVAAHGDRPLEEALREVERSLA